ncbi:Cyanamide hydratase [Lachnellula occidentalis]|uniref:Cyanamide hydratase n=1 Tax=Lachnellula occidentalis TaxID=215460 RepID=A0A8H8S791_9HELO|nr:Cyanamide hydratase [Lachnellula occidentalis]
MSSPPADPSIAAYGFTAVPRSVTALLALSTASTSPAKPIAISSIPLPSSELARKVQEYAEKELPVETFNHSMRVYYFGLAILTHAFPTWSTPSFTETYLLTALLHDLGSTPTHLPSTHLSFEFHGAILALSLLKSLSSPIPQAESVAEAIIRHQDLGEAGTLTRITALLQLATILDNMGSRPHADLVAMGTIESVVGKYPRKGWSGCFAKTIRRENGLKPWAHTTVLGEADFPVGVEGNVLMAPFDDA